MSHKYYMLLKEQVSIFHPGALWGACGYLFWKNNWGIAKNRKLAKGQMRGDLLIADGQDIQMQVNLANGENVVYRKKNNLLHRCDWLLNTSLQSVKFFRAGVWRHPHCLLSWACSKVQPCAKSHSVRNRDWAGRSVYALLPWNSFTRDIAERKNTLLESRLRPDKDLTTSVGKPSPMAWLSRVLLLSLKDVEIWNEENVYENRGCCRAWDQTSWCHSAWAYQTVWNVSVFNEGETPESL